MTMLAQEINVIRIKNPFDPREHIRENLSWAPEKTMSDYFPELAIEVEHVYSINGKIIYPDEFHVTYLNAGDSVVCCPVLTGGGGGGKNIFRLVAMIAIAVFAPWAAAMIGPSMGIAAGTMGMTMLSAGISIVGGMLLNAIMPPPKPNQGAGGGGSGLDSSPTYGIDGAKNTSAENLPVPVCYGPFRMGGNIIANHVVNKGNTQTLYMLFNAGEGPIAGISKIEINDQPIHNFNDYEVLTRLGTGTQNMIPWFDDILEPHNVGATLSTDWFSYITNGEVDKVRFDFVFPAGIFHVDTVSGVSSKRSVTLEAQYRLAGTGDSFVDLPDTGFVTGRTETTNWVEFPEYSGDEETGVYITYVPDGSEKRIEDTYYSTKASNGIERDVVVGNIIQTPEFETGLTISVKSKAPYRESLSTPTLPEAKYEFRIRRTNAQATGDYDVDQIMLSDVNEIVSDNIRYKNTALLAIKIQLGDQLNGIPKVTFRNEGRIIRCFDDVTQLWTTENSTNPAWITMDIMTNKRYGGGLAWSRFNERKFKELATHCNDNDLNFHGIFDTSMNLWDASQHVLRCGHAQFVNVGTRYSVAIEKEDTPVMMFSVANMIEGTFQQQWLPMNDRANEIEATFFDKNDKNKQKTIRMVDEIAATLGKPSISTSVTLFGVNSHSRARKDAKMLLNMNRYIQQTVEFGAPLEAIGCTVGDVVFVQHDIPHWGDSGRLLVSSTTSVLKLDRPVLMETEKTYTALVLYDSIQRASGTLGSISGVSGNYSVILNGFLGTEGRVRRLQVAGKDLTVHGTYTSGAEHGVYLDSVTGLSGGQAYTLHDTDVMEERGVVLNVGTQTDITLQSVLPSAPVQYVQWMFGEVSKVKKPFRVKAINGDGNYRRDLVCIEYNESVYDLSGVAIPTPNYSDLEIIVTHSTIETVSEELFKVNDVLRTRATVHFANSQPTYLYSNVFVSRNGSRFQSIGSDVDSVSTEADDGEELIFRVVAVHTGGFAPPKSKAPTYTHTIIGKTAVPADVTGFVISGTKLFWSPIADLDLLGYVVRYQLGQDRSWNDAIPLYLGEVTETFFDFETVPSGPITFMVKAVDTSRERYSVNAAYIYTNVGDQIEANIVQSFDFKALGFPGTVIGATVVSGDLKADDASGLMWSTNAATTMWGFDSSLMWNTTVYSAMSYELNDIFAFEAGLSSRLLINRTIAGEGVTLEYRRQAPMDIWTIDSEPMWTSDSAEMWRVGIWQAWPGLASVYAEPYDFRVTVTQGAIQGVISEFEIVIDMPDIIERFDDVVIDPAGTRLPITRTYRKIKNVNLTLQEDGGTATVIKTLDKDEILGPLVGTFDLGIGVGGLADAIVQGY